jgi:hypothetical protein
MTDRRSGTVTLLEQHPEHEQQEGRGREAPAFEVSGAFDPAPSSDRLVLNTEYMVSLNKKPPGKSWFVAEI